MARRTKKYLWAPFGAGIQALAASGAVGVDLLSLIRTAIPSINNFTIVRIRGYGGVRRVATGAAAQIYEAAMIVVTQSAFDAGAFPDVENDDASYMYRETWVWTLQLTRETAVGTFVTSHQLYQIDVKAKRRVDQADNTLVFAIKNRQAIAADFIIEGMALLDLR